MIAAIRLRRSGGRKLTPGRRKVSTWRHCLALVMVLVTLSLGATQDVAAAESSLSSGTLFAAPPGTPSAPPATPSLTPPASPAAPPPAPSSTSETTVPPSRPAARRPVEDSAGSANTAVPALTRRVTDQTGTLDASTVSRIEAKLQALEADKGAQIAVLMIPTTDGESIEQYAVRVFEAWNLGRKKVDDGALLVVAKNDRTLRIEVGYGLEGAVTDAQAARIIREQITPRFRNGDFSGGVEAGVNALAGLVQGEALPPVEKAKANAANTVRNLPTEALMAAGLVLIILPVWAAALIGAAAGFLFSGSLPIGLMAGFAGIVLSIMGKAFLPGGAARAMSRRGRAGGGFGGFGGGFGGGLGGGRGGGGFVGGGGGGFGGGGGRSGGGGASGSW